MRKSLIILLVVVVLGGVAALVLTSPAGISVGGFDLGGGGERRWLADRSIDFLEDIQFKDFKKASAYHLPKTQAARDIPAMIQKVFAIKHEILDITQYKVLEVDLDRSKTRARVRMQVDFGVLGERSMREDPGARRNVEMFLYWFKQDDGTWAMELESSLR